MHIQLDPRRVLRVLIGTIIVLTVANVAVQIASHGFEHFRLLGFVRLFNVNLEANIPSYFSALQLAAAAILLGSIAAWKRAQRDRFARHWMVLALVFAFLSVDEAAILHEMWIEPLRERFVLTGVWRHAWYIPYGLLLIGFGLGFWRFVFALSPTLRLRFIVAGGVFLSGAVGLEMASGVVAEMRPWDTMASDFRQAVLYSMEEPLEMLGIALFVHALVSEAAHLRLNVGIGFVAADAREAFQRTSPPSTSSASAFRLSGINGS